eukprot:scaffold10915_cov65-Phaeocystis_antarctica.AAC.3
MAPGFELRPRAIRLRSAAPPMGLPSSWMLPETRCAFPLSLMRLASTLSSDVLPAPEGPIIAQVLPPPSEPDTPLRICFSFLPVPTPYLTRHLDEVHVIGEIVLLLLGRGGHGALVAEAAAGVLAVDKALSTRTRHFVAFASYAFGDADAGARRGGARLT